VIEDLDGATSEPSRRTHVAVLSAATAALAIVLFYVLVAPPIFDGAQPQAASPSPTRTFSMTVASIPLNLPLDMTHPGVCADRASWGELHFAVDAKAPPAIVIYDRTGSRPIAFVREERGTGRLVVSCPAPDSFVPRINRAR